MTPSTLPALLVGLLVAGASPALSLWPVSQEDAPQEDAAPVAEVAQEATDSIRARVTLLNARVYVCDLSFDAEGRLTAVSRSIPGGAAIDFSAVRKLERVDELGRAEEPPLRVVDADVLTLLRRQVLSGTVVTLEQDALQFDSRGFGRVRIPREQLGELSHGAPGLGGDSGASGDDDGEDGPAAAAGGAWDTWTLGEGASVKDSFVELGKFGASIEREVDLAGKRIDISLQWAGKPEFRIVLGRSEGDELPTGVVLEPWAGHPTLYSFADGELVIAESDERLAMDSGGILHLVVTEAGMVEVVSLESFEGGRLEIGNGIPLTTEPSALRIETRGRPVEILTVDIVEDLPPDPERIVEFTRPVRGAEIADFDPAGPFLLTDRGRALLADVPGIVFVPRDRRGELELDEPLPGLGRVRLATGELLEVTTVDIEGGDFVVDSPFLVGQRRFALADIVAIDLPQRRNTELTGTFELKIGKNAPFGAGVQRIAPTETGVIVERGEPGFLTSVAAESDEALSIVRTARPMLYVSGRSYPMQFVLADGQLLTGALESVDPEHYAITTPFQEGTIMIPRAEVRALRFDPNQADFLLSELAPKAAEEANAARLQGVMIINGNGGAAKPRPELVTREELDRSLLVPRNQKSDPGSILLVARNGDLLRTNLVGLDSERGRVLVEGGSGGAMSIPLDVLALGVHLAPPLAAEGDDAAPEAASDDEDDDAPEATADGDESKDSAGDWVLDLGQYGLLRGTLVSADRETLVFDHGLLGRVQMAAEDFSKLTYKLRMTPRFEQFAGWRTVPMPEPRLQAD